MERKHENKMKQMLISAGLVLVVMLLFWGACKAGYDFWVVDVFLPLIENIKEFLSVFVG